MNKKELVNLIGDKASLTKKDAEIALNAVLDSLTEVLAKGDSIALPGFANFSVKKRAARCNISQNLTLTPSFYPTIN